MKLSAGMATRSFTSLKNMSRVSLRLPSNVFHRGGDTTCTSMIIADKYGGMALNTLQPVNKFV